MDLLLLYTPSCAPDAQLAETLPSRQEAQAKQSIELESFLACNDSAECQRCCRRRRQPSFHAYAEQASIRGNKGPSRPPLKGCRLLIAQVKHLICCCGSRRKYKVLTRYRYHQQKKPYSAISVHVEQLTAETYNEDDLAGLPDLIEVVRLQGTGPAEVSRALRKKLKYGNVHRQLRALTILDGLLQNGTPRMQKSILSDGPLLERLRLAAVDSLSDHEVQAKCKTLFSQWVASSKENSGLEGAKSLYNQLPKKARLPPQQRRDQSRVLRETEEDVRREEDEDLPLSTRNTTSVSSEPSLLRKNNMPTAPAISLNTASTFGTRKVKKDKKAKGKPVFHLEREKPALLQAIAASSVAATNLNNALKLVNREDKRVSDDPEALSRFETCKALRRQILRYIQYVESDEFLGGLIHANEELVTALMSFEVLDKSIDDDSDSELEEAQHLSRQSAASEKAALAHHHHHQHKSSTISDGVAGLSIQPPQKPPRPNLGHMATPAAAPANASNWRTPKHVENDSEDESDDQDEEDDDPFADRNAVKTPQPRSELGRSGYTWKEV